MDIWVSSDLIFTILFKRDEASKYIKGVFDEIFGKRSEMITNKEPTTVYQNTVNSSSEMNWN